MLFYFYVLFGLLDAGAGVTGPGFRPWLDCSLLGAIGNTLGDFTFWISLSLSLKTERKA